MKTEETVQQHLDTFDEAMKIKDKQVALQELRAVIVLLTSGMTMVFETLEIIRKRLDDLGAPRIIKPN